MDLPPPARRQHGIGNALGKARLALQLLEQVGTLSATERQIIATGLDGLAELDAILRDGMDRQLIGQPCAAIPTSIRASCQPTDELVRRPPAAARGPRWGVTG
jgi:hypothetical protein